MNKLAVAVIALILSSVLHAAEVGGVRLDDRISLGGQELSLNGAGIRSRAIFKIYVASLYVPQKTADPASVLAKGPRRIQLNLLRTLSAEQLAEALNDGLAEANSPAELEAVKPQDEQLHPPIVVEARRLQGAIGLVDRLVVGLKIGQLREGS